MNEITTTQPKTMMIKNLCPGLAEIGKIKIGNKGAKRPTQGGGSTWQPPQKLDHFIITTLERGEDGNFLKDERLHAKFGEKPKAIPVRLVYDNIPLNFATRYICYYGKTVFCSGDGETAQRLQQDGTLKTITCPCGRQDPKYNGDDGPAGKDCVGGKNGKGKCKINGILSTIIDGAEVVGGVWKFRTTSYNSVVGILSSLALISRITGGRLAGIPLQMTVTPKTVQDPINQGQQTVHIVGLQFVGAMDTLRTAGYQIAMDEAKHGISMTMIEEQARMLLTHSPTSGLGDDPDDDVVGEFYPEEAEGIVTGTGNETPQYTVKVDKNGYVTGAGVTTDGAPPPLVGMPAAQENTDAPKRERGKPSPGKQRRTAAEVEEDRLADEADAQAKLQQGEPGQETGQEQQEFVDQGTGEVFEPPPPPADGEQPSTHSDVVDLF